MSLLIKFSSKYRMTVSSLSKYHSTNLVNDLWPTCPITHHISFCMFTFLQIKTHYVFKLKCSKIGYSFLFFYKMLNKKFKFSSLIKKCALKYLIFITTDNLTLKIYIYILASDKNSINFLANLWTWSHKIWGFSIRNFVLSHITVINRSTKMKRYLAAFFWDKN